VASFGVIFTCNIIVCSVCRQCVPPLSAREESDSLLVPPAASFWVPSLPDIHQDPLHPLNIYAGHISSDPHASEADPADVTAHLYFVMVKNRRHADKERVMFWFNVCFSYASMTLSRDETMFLGRTWVFFIRWIDDGSWTMEDGWKGWV